MGTVKAGYLHKLSGFFKNSWKKRYFVLYQDGVFSYYQDAKDKECDGKIHMKTECRRINVGNAVGEGVKPPKDSDINSMFCVSSPERTWYLYADSGSEAREWISVLEQARVPLTYGGPQNPPAGPSYPAYSAPTPAAYGAAPNPAAPPPIGFNPSVIQGASPGPPPPYSQGPPPYPSGPPPPGYAPPPYPQSAAAHAPQPSYPQQPYNYPQQPPGGYPQQAPRPHYPAPPPGQYPQQQYYHGNPPQQMTYVQGGPPQTMYVQQQPQSHSGRNKMMMGAAAGVVGGAAMGYMLGHTVGGIGHGFGHHHGFGGWGSDHSWSSGGSFDCDFD